MNKKTTDMLLCALLVAGLMALCGWFAEGFLRVILLTALYFLEAEIVTSILRLVLGEPEPQKLPKEEMIRQENQWYLERQNPAVATRLKPWGIVLIIASVALVIWGMIGTGSYEVYSVICLVFVAVCTVLAVLFSAYFSIVYIEGEKNSGFAFSIVNVSLPLTLVLFGCSYRSITEFVFVSWMSVLKGTVITAAVLGMMLPVLPELRRSNSNRIGAMVLALVLSFGLTAAGNHLLKAEPPEIVTATVVKYNPGGHRNPPDYDVLVEDGEQINISAVNGFDRLNFRIGEEIKLEFHEGAFGIDYYHYSN